MATQTPRFTLKLETVNMNDLRISTNDDKIIKIVCDWFSSATQNKTKPSKASKLVKHSYYLDNARKDGALGPHWIVVITDKLLELGYKPAFATTNVAATDAVYVFISNKNKICMQTYRLSFSYICYLYLTLTCNELK